MRPFSAHFHAVLVTVALTILPNSLVTFSDANIVKIRDSSGRQQARGVVGGVVAGTASFLSEGLGLNATVKSVEPEAADDNADCTSDGRDYPDLSFSLLVLHCHHRSHGTDGTFVFPLHLFLFLI